METAKFSYVVFQHNKRIKNDVKRLADAHSSLILAKHYPHFMRALGLPWSCF
ncbi:hypothetical protein PAUR_b1150 [Pseudoalteromonas aurantia 208]|uniref:Orphan protein n=1 Tax=Pseudoalteromonas aurantia 208 TaxID=1314867 RepID=A0ABR9EJW4_9GAMM|nr:hypothetical protein [Pseudoalteromonas aurantia 208]